MPSKEKARLAFDNHKQAFVRVTLDRLRILKQSIS